MGGRATNLTLFLCSFCCDEMLTSIVVFLGILAVAASQQCCKVHGDPHVLTFDKYAYDYMGSGTFILAQEAVYQEWMVYGVFKPCGDRSKQLSCIVGISVLCGGETVQFLRMFRMNYQGREYSLQQGTSTRFGNIMVQYSGMKYEISITNKLDAGAVKVYWDGITVAQICLPEKCSGGVEGLCANADCDSTNEFNKMGAMNMYGSWVANSKSEFGNSWVVKGNADDLEPQSGNLPASRTRPCDFVSASLRQEFEARCNLVLEHSYFQDCLSRASFEVSLYRQNCMFDSCAGLLMGAGCSGDRDGQCKDELEGKVLQAIARGMSEAEARRQLIPRPLDPACMTGMALADDCRTEGYYVMKNWVDFVDCPNDNTLLEMRVCP